MTRKVSHLVVYVDGIGDIELPAFGDGIRQAWEIADHGVKVYEGDCVIIYPKHRIANVRAIFEPLPKVEPVAAPERRLALDNEATHVLERESPKGEGQDYLGYCIRCGVKGLDSKAVFEFCENTKGLSYNDALLEVIEGPSDSVI